MFDLSQNKINQQQCYIHRRVLLSSRILILSRAREIWKEGVPLQQNDTTLFVVFQIFYIYLRFNRYLLTNLID